MFDSEQQRHALCKLKKRARFMQTMCHASCLSDVLLSYPRVPRELLAFQDNLSSLARIFHSVQLMV